MKLGIIGSLPFDQAMADGTVIQPGDEVDDAAFLLACEAVAVLPRRGNIEAELPLDCRKLGFVQRADLDR